MAVMQMVLGAFLALPGRCEPVKAAFAARDAIVVWNPETGFTKRARERWTAAGLADLTNALAKVTGTEPKVFVEGTEPADAKAVIYYADTRHAREAGCDPETLRRGDWRLKTEPGRAYVYAKAGAGSAFAATDFVERYCGYDFLTVDGCDPYDFNPNLTIPCADVTVRPAIYQRSVYTSLYGDWSALERRRRIAAFDGEIEPSFRVSYNVRDTKGQTRLCHSSYCYLPPEKHFKDHPDWYSVVDGRRQALPIGQICMSSEEARAECLQKLLEFVAKDRSAHPTDYPTVYDFTQQDNCDYLCRCDRCKATIAKYNRVPGGWKEGGDAGLQLEFVNWLATEVAKTYPDVSIRTFAYVSTERAPKPGTIAPAPNVNIWWCDLYSRSDHLRGLDTPDHFNANQLRTIREWLALTRNVTVWDYMLYGGNQGSPDCPEWAPDAIAADSRLFAELGVDRLFMETEIQPFIQPFFGLNLYLMSLCYVDPSTDVMAAARRYCRVYGEGAGKMFEALQLLRAAIAGSATKTEGEWHGRMLKFRNRETMERFLGLVREAYAAARRPGARIRIARVLMSTSRELIAIYRRIPGAVRELEEAKADYLRYGREFAASAPGKTVQEREKLVRKVEETLQILNIRFEDLPEDLRNEPRDSYSCLDCHYYIGGNANASRRDDPDSETGRACVWKYGKGDGEHAEKTIRCGVYDEPTKEAICAAVTPESAPFADEKYHWVRIGRAHLGRNTLFWIPADWNIGFRLSDFFITSDGAAVDPNWHDVYISIKLTGPAYHPGSKSPNGIWIDRIILR